MIRINLLPVKASRRVEAVKEEAILSGVVIGVLVLLCAGAYFWIGSQVSSTKAENKRLENEITQLKQVVARVDEIDKIKEDLTQKLQVIEQLKKGKTGPVHMLDELSNATPEKVSITKLSEEGGKLELEGLAVSNEVISQFLSNLERSEWFDLVYLVGIDQVEQEGYKLKKFQVTADVVVPKTPEEIEAERIAAEKAAQEEAAKAKAKTKAKVKVGPPSED